MVYHVPKSKGAAVDLNGMEGEVASRADDLNGTYISANLEIRVAFAVPDDPKGKTFIAPHEGGRGGGAVNAIDCSVS